MIITRTPFRVSLCGGGSDLPSFYEKHGGCVLSTTIKKYMYITVHPSFDNKIALKYSKTEIVEKRNEIEHNYFRQCLNDFNISGVEITSIADIPQGTGLGSSSSFTVGLLNALYCYKREYVSKEKLASEACEVEIDKLKNPIGKQDQYAAAYGGLNFYKFNKDGSVDVTPVLMNKESYNKLEDNLIMLYVGGIHSASEILKEQSKNVTSAKDKENNLLEMCKMTEKLKYELENNNIDYVGETLHKSWLLKKTLAKGISNPEIDKYYDLAIKNGATGGKLLGAGGCGFLLFYVPCENQEKFREAMKELKEVEFKFDHQGSVPIFVN
ncbi:MAG: GHMP kinase [Bacilli bacterium]|nr:GHMP kinase [Bacilli bacterium]